MCGVEYSQRAREVRVAVTTETELLNTEGTETLPRGHGRKTEVPEGVPILVSLGSYQHAHSEVLSDS